MAGVFITGHPEQLPSDSTGNVVRSFVYSGGVATETLTFTTTHLEPGGTDGTLVYKNGKLVTRTDQS